MEIVYPTGFCVYIVGEKKADGTIKRTYVGYTNNFARRIRQHRGEISGGAKCTSRFSNCHPLLIISGFPDNKTALKYEWRLKRLTLQCKKRDPWLRRCSALTKLLQLTQATKTCTLRINFEDNVLVHYYIQVPQECIRDVSNATLITFVSHLPVPEVMEPKVVEVVEDNIIEISE
uniref:GIY-YIG type nuclease n=1 Tax=Clandestinovirus TaxID=2831644 RepID=A0A8F8KNN2_9VIRU|nr:GIY-YIG type nuclease [Clandestinovirus]